MACSTQSSSHMARAFHTQTWNVNLRCYDAREVGAGTARKGKMNIYMTEQETGRKDRVVGGDGSQRRGMSRSKSISSKYSQQVSVLSHKQK